MSKNASKNATGVSALRCGTIDVLRIKEMLGAAFPPAHWGPPHAARVESIAANFSLKWL